MLGGGAHSANLVRVRKSLFSGVPNRHLREHRLQPLHDATGGWSIQQHVGPPYHHRVPCSRHDQLRPGLQPQPLHDLGRQLDCPLWEDLGDGYDRIVRQQTVDRRPLSSLISLVPRGSGNLRNRPTISLIFWCYTFSLSCYEARIFLLGIVILVIGLGSLASYDRATAGSSTPPSIPAPLLSYGAQHPGTHCVDGTLDPLTIQPCPVSGTSPSNSLLTPQGPGP